MSKLNLLLVFVFFYPCFTHAQTAFMGDVTDYNYINRYAFTQVICTYQEQNKTPKTIVYSFGENNKLVEKKEQNNNRTVIYKYTYDNNWNVIEAKKQVNNALVSIEKYTYDTTNCLAYKVLNRIEEKDSITETTIWTDANTKNTKRFDGFKETHTLTSFDEKHRPINEIKEDGTGYEWAYVDDILVMCKIKANKGELKDIDRYDYDNENRIRTIENSQTQKTFHYDNSGLLAKIQVFDANGLLIGWEKFEYVFPNK